MGHKRYIQAHTHLAWYDHSLNSIDTTHILTLRLQPTDIISDVEHIEPIKPHRGLDWPLPDRAVVSHQ